MATFNVSGASQLASAINSARGGDVIRCAAGNYGKLNLTKKFSGNVTITSASDGNKASFAGIDVRNAANVTFDSLKIDGPGKSGTGLKVSLSNNVKVTDSDVSDFLYGMQFSRVTGLTVSNNDLSGMWNDCMRFGQVINATISGNDFEQRNSQPNYTHKDLIQFWTSGAEGPSKNVRITGNRMDSPDGETHAIYMGNDEARGGNRSKFYQDIHIENNYVRTSQVHGISVEHVNGLVIRNNNVIHNKDRGETKMVAVPLINVSSSSTDVDIIGNTAPSIPKAANSSWTVYGNKETGSSSLIHWNGIGGGRASGAAAQNVEGSGATALAAAAESAPESADSVMAGPMMAPSAAGSDAADVFRFLGSKLGGGITTDTLELDFAEGDTLVLAQYDDGTFRDVSGGNVVWNNAAGSYVEIDTLADLKELADASPAIAVSADRAADVVTFEIEQGGATHRIRLEGLADEFLGL